MSYVDGFVLPGSRRTSTPTLRSPRKAGAIWREHGALAHHECVADDVKRGVHTSIDPSQPLE